MKSFILFACLSFTLFTAINAGSPEPLNIGGNLEGDFFTATTDDSEDRLVSIKVYDTGNVLRAEKTCGYSLNCTIDLSLLTSGSYSAKVYTQFSNTTFPIYLN